MLNNNFKNEGTSKNACAFFSFILPNKSARFLKSGRFIVLKLIYSNKIGQNKFRVDKNEKRVKVKAKNWWYFNHWYYYITQ